MRARYLLSAVAALVVAVGSASAAAPSPSALVLQQTDVPEGFELVRDESGVRTNEAEGRMSSEARAFFVRWKRVTGYQAVWERGSRAKLEARSDLFRTAAGAEALLELTDREWRGSGISGQSRSSLRIGTSGVVYWSGGSVRQTLVLWRHGRVFSGLNGFVLSRAQVIALARKQQRRIAAALR